MVCITFILGKRKQIAERLTCPQPYQSSLKNKKELVLIVRRCTLTKHLINPVANQERYVQRYHQCIRRKEIVAIKQKQHGQCSPGVVLKSKMRWCDCSKSGLLDDKVPLTGNAVGICFVCLNPTMLSS